MVSSLLSLNVFTLTKNTMERSFIVLEACAHSFRFSDRIDLLAKSFLVLSCWLVASCYHVDPKWKLWPWQVVGRLIRARCCCSKLKQIFPSKGENGVTYSPLHIFGFGERATSSGRELLYNWPRTRLSVAYALYPSRLMFQGKATIPGYDKTSQFFQLTAAHL